MLEGYSIVCFAHDWSGDPTSKTHIMRILARRNRVLWVDSIGMRRPAASSADVRRLAVKLRKGLAGLREVEPNLLVLSPLAVPLPGAAWADRLNASILGNRLKRACLRHGLVRPILWSFLPNVGRLLGRLGERLVIYHCVDEYAAFSGVPRRALRRLERDLVRRSDLVLTSSERLQSERRQLNPNTHFVAHGVDVAHFSRALDPATEVPEAVRGLPRPVIGFMGLIADWVDLDLLGTLARRRPDWSLVLLGRAATDLAPLAGLRNVHWMGPKSYSNLPGYCKGFDAAIIPFRINELTIRANPLKLREYLAAGRAVVSTPLPEVARYSGLVRLAGGAAAFEAEIEQALREDSPARARGRVAAMRGEGWEARVEEISALVEARLEATALATSDGRREGEHETILHG